MTIASEIQRIQTNIANAYDAAEAKGATMPVTENSSNLATTIASISGGGGGDIITATNTKGSIISEGDKVWINIYTSGINSIHSFNLVTYNEINNSSLSGFAEENIAISGTGDVKTLLSDQINVSVTTNADDATILLEL